MSPVFAPSVDAAIRALRADYVALNVYALGMQPTLGARAGSTSPLTADALTERPHWAEAHLEAWREAYRAFGAKPQRTAPSADALTARLRRDGELPSINPVVDLYNRISVRYALPIGGENIDAYRGSPRLHVSQGHEVFETTKDGQPFLEAVPAGDVVWSDDEAVTCRRWNWRQGTRTRIEPTTTRMWFVLERLGPMPLEALQQAGLELMQGLRALSPQAQLSATLMDSHGTRPLTH
jgi:DNA/RNA-binding domain of Phe-tRNA-synthetase-like protein